MRNVVIVGLASCDPDKVVSVPESVAAFIETIPSDRLQYGTTYSRQVRENLHYLVRFSANADSVEVYKRRISLQLG
jgi:hypothetical protein